MKINMTTALIGAAGLYLAWRLYRNGTIGTLVNGPAAAPADQGNGTVTVGRDGIADGFDVILV